MKSAVVVLVATYLVLALVPLGVALAPPRPTGAAFLLELSLALGFIGLGQLAMQFGLIARFERISRPLGIDLVMQWHRQVGIVAALIVVAHPLVLVLWQPSNFALLNPFGGDTASVTGVVAVLSVLVLIALSIWRRQLGIGYEAWRVTHALLGITALLTAQTHVMLIGRYINVPWKGTVLWVWCIAFVALIAYLRIVKPIFLAQRAWLVDDVRPDAAGTWNLALVPRGSTTLRFAPGQFAWIKVGTSPWSTQEHPFSFSSSSENRRHLEFAIKELGDFTSGIGGIAEGTTVYVDGPHGSFSCDFAAAERLVLVAGGIGIAPMMSMIRTLADRGDTRPIALVYACSSWERVAFRDELLAHRSRPNFTLLVVLEQSHAEWDGPVGLITSEVLAPLVPGDGGDTQYMICGPDGMMTAVEQTLRQLGVSEQRIAMERFNLV